MTTIAVFGGSFNPPHVAHEMVCLYVLDTQPVDRVLMVPTYRHAFDKPLAPFEDRVAMCERAAAVFAGNVVVSSVEAEMGAVKSRTIHTLTRLAADNPGAAFRLVIGSDILQETDAWYRWSDITEMAPPIVVQRAGYRTQDDAAPALPEISSTRIRDRLSRGLSAVPLVSRSVMDYIAQRGLYR